MKLSETANRQKKYSENIYQADVFAVLKYIKQSKSGFTFILDKGKSAF